MRTFCVKKKFFLFLIIFALISIEKIEKVSVYAGEPLEALLKKFFFMRTFGT
jgi:hypothetical protein